MGPNALRFFHSLARKGLTKNRGSGITEIADRMVVESEAASMIQTLVDSGLPLERFDQFIRSEADVLKFLNIVKNANKPRVIPGTSAEGKATTEKLFGKKGEVVDFPQPKTFKQEIDAMKKSGDLVDEKDMVISDKITNREMFKNSNLNKPTVEGQMEKINTASNRIKEIQKEQADMYKPKSDAEIKAKYDKQNKESVERLKKKKRDSMPIRLMKNFEKELNEADLIAEGYSKDQANVLIKARKKMTSGEEMNPNESLLRVKEEFADKAGVDVEDFTDIDFEIDVPDFAKGGRAGFYTGGITDVEPSLDDIGHGSDSLMARTRLVSPGSQATTSTGLNYLLAEDNDNIRVPFGEGNTVQDKIKTMHKDFDDYRKSGGKISYKKFAAAYIPENFAEGGRIGFSAGGGGRRAFLKFLASIGGLTAAAKSGILGLGEGTTKKAITETVKQSAGSGYPPPYFFKLVEKIKFMGDDITEKAATQEREIVKKYKDFEMTEDMATGNIVIKKRNEGSFYDQDGIISDEYIVYKPGQADELTKGKKPPPEYDEYTVRPDGEGKLRDSEDGLDSIDEILEEVGDPDSMTLKKADGGRIGYVGGGLSKLGITGSSRRFLEKVFGKEKFKNLIENDPEMHRGLLEVAEMFRSKDKSGLVEYMQNFLPQMSKKELEAFVVGSGDTAGIEGQLIRLGSGRDYKNKLDMIEEANNVRKLEDFDIEGVSKNAEGGRIGFSGGGILRAIIANSAKKKGMSVTDFIKATNYKGLPPEVKMFLSAEDFAKLKSGQKEMYDNYIDMAKTRLEFQKNVEGGKNTPARELFESMEKTMDEQSMVPKTVTSDDVAEMELMVKNRFNKGRKDNAQGGLQTMLGE